MRQTLPRLFVAHLTAIRSPLTLPLITILNTISALLSPSVNEGREEDEKQEKLPCVIHGHQ
jgi:hypothetical protein